MPTDYEKPAPVEDVKAENGIERSLLTQKLSLLIVSSLILSLVGTVAYFGDRFVRKVDGVGVILMEIKGEITKLNNGSMLHTIEINGIKRRVNRHDKRFEALDVSVRELYQRNRP